MCTCRASASMYAPDPASERNSTPVFLCCCVAENAGRLEPCVHTPKGHPQPDHRLRLLSAQSYIAREALNPGGQRQQNNGAEPHMFAASPLAQLDLYFPACWMGTAPRVPDGVVMWSPPSAVDSCRDIFSWRSGSECIFHLPSYLREPHTISHTHPHQFLVFFFALGDGDPGGVRRERLRRVPGTDR
jgi:hypothetical protein